METFTAKELADFIKSRIPAGWSVSEYMDMARRADEFAPIAIEMFGNVGKECANKCAIWLADQCRFKLA